MQRLSIDDSGFGTIIAVQIGIYRKLISIRQKKGFCRVTTKHMKFRSLGPNNPSSIFSSGSDDLHCGTCRFSRPLITGFSLAAFSHKQKNQQRSREMADGALPASKCLHRRCFM
jgi:hypothetical protein